MGNYAKITPSTNPEVLYVEDAFFLLCKVYQSSDRFLHRRHFTEHLKMGVAVIGSHGRHTPRSWDRYPAQ